MAKRQCRRRRQERRRKHAKSIVGGIAVAACLMLAPTAGAATLVGDYQFQGTRASSGPGPALADVGGSNSFLSDNVMGVSRQVLGFPLDSGVAMTPAGLGGGGSAYSVVTTFRFDATSSYRRILDPSNGTSDYGFYQWNGEADIYPVGPEVYGPDVLFTPNVYATVAITSSPPSPSKMYVNGTLRETAFETLPVVADTLRFFKDDGTEDSAGAVSCVRVYSGVLTDAEVAGIGSSPTCGTVASAPTAAKKKCKKHKKKRSAEFAKKKKCKKKKH